MLSETTYEHIVLDERGVPVIEGTNLKVVELVSEMHGYGWDAEEIQAQHPYLALGQIHSALAYYWDHAEELDRDIERRLEKVSKIREQTPPSPLVNRLKAKGLI